MILGTIGIDGSCQLVQIRGEECAVEPDLRLVGEETHHSRLLKVFPQQVHQLPQGRPRLDFLGLAPQQADQPFARFSHATREQEIGDQGPRLAVSEYDVSSAHMQTETIEQTNARRRRRRGDQFPRGLTKFCSCGAGWPITCDPNQCIASFSMMSSQSFYLHFNTC